MLDLDRPLVPLGLAALRANLGLAAVTLVLTFAYHVVGSLRPDEPGFGEWLLSVGFDIVVICAIDTPLAIALYATLFTRGEYRGWAAVLRTPVSRVVAFYATLVVLSAVFLAAAFFTLSLGLPRLISAEGTLQYGLANLALWCAVAVAVSTVVGLVFPGILMTGEIRIGEAISLGVTHFGRLATLLLVSDFVLLAAGLIVDTIATELALAPRFFEALPGIDLSAAAVIGSGSAIFVLSDIFFATAVAKVYWEVTPAGGGRGDLPGTFE